jgi:hypothetical protein
MGVWGVLESAPVLQLQLARMINEHNRYVLSETAISVVINIVLSALFMFLVFGRSPTIELWGRPGLALDFVPQTFMISLMSVLVPSLITRRRMKSGRVAARASARLRNLPKNVVFRAIVIGCGLTVLLGGGAVLLLSAVWRGAAPFWVTFPLKLAYGVLVATIATPLGLYATLSEREHAF